MSDESQPGELLPQGGTPTAPWPPQPDPEPAAGWDARDASDYGVADEVPLAQSFLAIWTAPRRTIGHIVRRNPRYALVPLAAISGITSVLASLANRGAGPALSVGRALLLAFLAGPILGILGVFFGGWLVRLTGRWFLGGRGGPREVRAALAWAQVPSVTALPLWLLATAAFGAPLFQQSTVELFSASVVYAMFAICVTALRIWGIALAGATLAEVQGYRSAWKGLLNLLVAVLLLALVAGIAGALVVLAVGAGARLIA